ncbi:hypothetical protein IM711_13565 [Microbacterium esteraromaticum]|uniref:hypothetical protein n=1 Tax=Microbacterium esteraromaticum TaxID=57043 RepID=UPI003C2E6EB9
MGYDDYGWAAGLGIGMFILGAVVYLGVLALTIWVGYLIMRTAVKNGILKADEERARRGYAATSAPPMSAQAPGSQTPPAPATYPPSPRNYPPQD